MRNEEVKEATSKRRIMDEGMKEDLEQQYDARIKFQELRKTMPARGELG